MKIQSQLNNQIAKSAKFQSELRFKHVADTLTVGTTMGLFTVPIVKTAFSAMSGNSPSIWQINMEWMLSSLATSATTLTVITDNLATGDIMHIITEVRKSNTQVTDLLSLFQSFAFS